MFSKVNPQLRSIFNGFFMFHLQQGHLRPHRGYATWAHIARNTRSRLLSGARHPRGDDKRLQFPFGAAAGGRWDDSQQNAVANAGRFGRTGGVTTHDGRVECFGNNA